MDNYNLIQLLAKLDELMLLNTTLDHDASITFYRHLQGARQVLVKYHAKQVKQDNKIIKDQDKDSL